MTALPSFGISKRDLDARSGVAIARRVGHVHEPQGQSVDTDYVRTYHVGMNLTLSVDERTVRRARKVAESMGISLNQAVRRFLEELGGEESVDTDIAELNELSANSKGHSRGWRFDREAIHERRP